MKLLLDEHYPNEIASQLRAIGYDAVTVSERRLNGKGDEELLMVATAEGRALLTNNARDFVPISVNWMATGRDHCGLLLTADAGMPRTKGNVGAYVNTLDALFQANPEPEALENQIRWLP